MCNCHFHYTTLTMLGYLALTNGCSTGFTECIFFGAIQMFDVMLVIISLTTDPRELHVIYKCL